MFQLKRIETESQWTDFIDLPSEIYKSDANWVPPLKQRVRDLLDVNKNPFFKHAYMFPIVAYQNEKPVGRIVGIINDHHNRFHKESTVFFGFFECINNQNLADRLFDEVVRWAKSRGMNNLRGPVSPDLNHESGLLVEGYSEAPSVMTPYNPPYYSKLFQNWGLKKTKDLFAYEIDGRQAKLSEKLLGQAEKLKEGGSVTFRTFRMGEFEQEIDRIIEIYNDTRDVRWGFVPLDPEELSYKMQDLKQILDPELAIIAEVRGEPAGFAIALPDINQAIKKLGNGKTSVSGIIKLWWNIKGPGRRKTINRCRIFAMGVKKDYRNLGIGPLLYGEYIKRAPAQGYLVSEASWVADDNAPINQALEQICGNRTKVYRVYDRAIAQ